VSTLITGIGSLVSNDPELGEGPLGLLTDAALVIEGERIAWAGPAAKAPEADEVHDAGGRAVIPGFVDSHAHLVFAGDRAAEFSARMSGRPYQAGGIRTTVAATRAASDEQLDATVRRLVGEALRQGTTSIECKSGYGLTVQDEARALRIAAAHTPELTYLGAHVVAPEYADDPAAYVELVTGPMLDACAPHARWIDVFCERGAFDGDQARAVLRAGAARGLGLRVHANQLGHGPASSWPWNSAPPPPTTAPTSPTPTWTRWSAAPLSPPCSPAPSSPPAPATRTPAACWTPAPSSPSPPTATRAPASPRPSPSASRWRSARWA
jgi:imidazolonepropionase